MFDANSTMIGGEITDISFRLQDVAKSAIIIKMKVYKQRSDRDAGLIEVPVVGEGRLAEAFVKKFKKGDNCLIRGYLDEITVTLPEGIHYISTCVRMCTFEVNKEELSQKNKEKVEWLFEK